MKLKNIKVGDKVKILRSWKSHEIITNLQCIGETMHSIGEIGTVMEINKNGNVLVTTSQGTWSYPPQVLGPANREPKCFIDIEEEGNEVTIVDYKCLNFDEVPIEYQKEKIAFWDATPRLSKDRRIELKTSMPLGLHRLFESKHKGHDWVAIYQGDKFTKAQFDVIIDLMKYAGNRLHDIKHKKQRRVVI